MIETEQDAEELTKAIFDALNNRIDLNSAQCCEDEETYKLLKSDVLDIIRRKCGLENEYELIIRFETPKPINEYFKEPLLKRMAETLGQTLMKQQQNFKRVIERDLKRIEVDNQ